MEKEAPDPISEAVGKAIRAERSRKRMTQTQLADALHRSQSTVAAIETGNRKLLVAELPAVCRALGVPLSRLLADLDPDDLDALGLPRS